MIAPQVIFHSQFPDIVTLPSLYTQKSSVSRPSHLAVQNPCAYCSQQWWNFVGEIYRFFFSKPSSIFPMQINTSDQSLDLATSALVVQNGICNQQNNIFYLRDTQLGALGQLAP